MGQFIKGMDISSYPEMMDKQFKYYDFDGKEVNLLDFAKEQGFNYGRLRIWNEPKRVPESGGYCNLKDTLKMAKEIVQRGMGLLLDFHYSDWWADPGHQELPYAWKDFSEDELVEAVYCYTKEVMTALDENGTYPDMVQIGNEIRCGMMWPIGAITNWPGLAKLLNAGIRAVRDTQGHRETKIVIHLDQGGRYYYYEEWFDAALEHGVTDFDIIGLSYYPFWHGTFHDLKNTMENLVARYDKPLILAEMAHAYRKSQGNLFGEAQEKIAGFPANPDAQRTVLELIMSIAAHVSKDMGLGVFYWEPFWQTKEDDDSWASCMVLVDHTGMPTEGCKAFAVNPKETDMNRIAKIYEPKAITVPSIDAWKNYLPRQVRVLMWDGRIENRDVCWEMDAVLSQQEHHIQGVLSSGERVSVSVRIDTNARNLIHNGDFEEELSFWEIDASRDVRQEIRQEIAEEFPFETKNYFYFTCKENLTLVMKQKLAHVEKGSYLLSLEYLGDNTTGVKVWMYAKCGDREYKVDIFPTDSEWVRHEIIFEVENTGDIEVGLEVDSPAMYGKVRDVRVVKR